MTALELWTCVAILVAMFVWALWPDAMRWVRRRRATIYDQEADRG